MPKAYDLKQMTFNDPNQRIDTAFKLPPLDPIDFIRGVLDLLKQTTGIDLTGFFDWLVGLIPNFDWAALPTPEDAWGAVIHAFLDPLSGIGNAITQAFNGVALVSPDVAVQNVWDAITGTLGIGHNAQGTADDAWSAILAMKAILGGISVGTGTSGSDTFDGAATSSLPNYTELFWGSASNHYKLNGSGRAVFNQSGFLENNIINLLGGGVTTAFIGNAQTTGIYLPTAIAPGTAAILINNFSWTTTKEAACAFITSNTVQAGYMDWTGSAFAFHLLGSANSYVSANGEYWQFDYGDVDSTPAVTNPNMYRVFRNGAQVLTFDDSSSPHITLSSAHTSIAWGGYSAPGFPSLVPAPPLDSFAYWERA